MTKPTHPPNLKVLNRGESPGQSEERRRLPRLNLSGEQFRLTQTGQMNGKIFAVVDLSRNGMALRLIDSEDLRAFPVAGVVEGQLNLNRQKYQVSARVKNVRPDVVGCEFENLSVGIQDALKRCLDPEFLGKELRPIPASGSTLWYHGPSGTDVLLWRGVDGQYRKMTIYIQGNYIQWESDQGASTGRALISQERAEVQGILRFETLMLMADQSPDSAKMKVAERLLLSSNLPQDLKTWCVRKFEAQ
jgi:hypothetical protein